MTAIVERRKARQRLRLEARKGVSYGLAAWLEDDAPSTLGTLNDTFGEKILAVACLALMAPSALPIPTGGATHVFDVIAILFSGQMVLGRRTMWLPERWQKREVGPKSTKGLRLLLRFVRWSEKISKPRLHKLMASRMGSRVLGLVMTIFIVGAFISPPFSGLDTLPSLGVVLIALGILLEDALFAIVGLIAGVGGIGLTLTIGMKGIRAIGHLL